MVFPAFLSVAFPCGIHLWFVCQERTVRKLAPAVPGFLLMYVETESQTRAKPIGQWDCSNVPFFHCLWDDNWQVTRLWRWRCHIASLLLVLLLVLRYGHYAWHCSRWQILAWKIKMQGRKYQRLEVYGLAKVHFWTPKRLNCWARVFVTAS